MANNGIINWNFLNRYNLAKFVFFENFENRDKEEMRDKNGVNFEIFADFIAFNKFFR